MINCSLTKTTFLEVRVEGAWIFLIIVLILLINFCFWCQVLSYCVVLHQNTSINILCNSSFCRWSCYKSEAVCQKLEVKVIKSWRLLEKLNRATFFDGIFLINANKCSNLTAAIMIRMFSTVWLSLSEQRCLWFTDGDIKSRGKENWV